MDEEDVPKSLCRGCKKVAVIVLCGCGGSPASLCRDCLKPHLEIHRPPPSLPVRDPPNTLCQFCKHFPPDVICPCVLPPVCVCNQCLPGHIAKRLGEVHTILPVKALPYITSLRYAKDLNDRRERLEAAKGVFQKNLDKLTEAEKAIEATFKSMFTELNEQEVKLRKTVMTARETLMQLSRESLEVIEERIFDTKFIPQDAVSHIILTSRQIDQDLDLVSVQKQSIPSLDVSELIEVSVTIPKNPNVVPPLLAKISQVNFHIFDCESETWRDTVRLSEQIESDFGTSVCFVGEERLFVSGKFKPTTANTYFVDVGSGQVEIGRRMGDKRSQHGVIHVNGAIYAFGGYTDRKAYITSCEKYSISQHVWSPLPPLSCGKNAFNPVLHQGKVYITAGRFRPSTEVFDLATETMTPFSVNIPKPFRRTEGDYASCSFVDQDDLVILRTEEEYRLSLSVELPEPRTRRIQLFFPWSNSTPVVIGGRVFVIQYRLKKVAHYDVESRRWKVLDQGV